jgi:hypothetical protein
MVLYVYDLVKIFHISFVENEKKMLMVNIF